MKISLVCASFVLIGTNILSLGQTLTATHSLPFPPFTVTEGNLDADGFPVSGAKLCVLTKKDLCFQMPSEIYGSSEGTKYEFGLEPHYELLKLKDRGYWVFFSALFSGGGSGTLTRFAVLRYEGDNENGRIVNLLPYVAATNVSEWAIWPLPDSSAFPVLVHADFVWGKGEYHFDSHFYTVEAWVFDSNVDKYVNAFEYKTSRKYSGGDSSPIRVLRPERNEILRRLKSVQK